MKRLLRQLRTAALIGALATLGALFVPSASAAFRYLQEGMTAPVIEGIDLRTGEIVSSKLADDDGVVIVTFWASWSQRSLDLLADLKTIVEEHPDHAFRVLAVNVDRGSLSPQARQLIESTVAAMALPFPVIIDDELSRFYEFGVIAVPSTAIIDSTGTLRYAPSGYSYTIRDRIVDSIEVLLGLKEPDTAAALVQGYVPTNKSSRYYNLALQLTNKRSYERALANLEQAEAADSQFSAVHNLRGQIYLELDSAKAALPEFALAIGLDSNSVAAWAGWGRGLLQTGAHDDAYTKLEAALAREPSYTPALLDLALCLAERQEPAQALDSLRVARELNPQDPAVHMYLGNIYRRTGHNDSAVTAFQEALGLLFPSP
jgi:Tfp pilus assembly protein PilF/thiol-disulfide isomerase/thioredoxin